MENGNVINDVLVHLFNEVWQLEKNALTTGDFKDLKKRYAFLVSWKRRKFPVTVMATFIPRYLPFFAIRKRNVTGWPESYIPKD